MNRTKTLDLTQGAIFKVLLAFVLPILAGSLIQQLYTVVDAVVVGRFAGQAGLAAIDSVYTLFKFPLNFMSGLAAGATIVVSKCFGAGDEKNLSGAIRAALVIAAVLGAVFSAAGAFAAPVLADVMQVPADIRQYIPRHCSMCASISAACGLWPSIICWPGSSGLSGIRRVLFIS